ncbi:MAG: carboxypeptidase regulatory-like domain-containing protein [Pyrinomonadaceae bacterium]
MLNLGMFYTSALRSLILSLFLATSFIAQQSDNGGLSGTVTDEKGAVVPGATVVASNSLTGLKRQATSNEEGRWTILSLKAGEYQVIITATGFAEVKRMAAVSSGNTTPVDIALGVATVGEVVDVSSNEDTVIKSETLGEVSTKITGNQIAALPLPLRDFKAAILRDTNISANISDPLDNSSGAGEISIAGGRPTSVALIKDGIDATNLVGQGSLSENLSPAPEFLDEVKLLVGNYDASLGRTGGGNVQLVTKGGGQKYSGSAWAYIQNEIFNANDFFFNRDGIDRQKASRFEGGFSVGGPLVKDRVFFFGGYQRTDATTGYVSSASGTVVLPEALAFLTTRTTENIRQAFAQTAGDLNGQGFNRAGCVRNTPYTDGSAQTALLTCISTLSPFYRLLTTRNPVTGGFVIPNLRPGYERLFSNPANVFLIDPADRSRFPNGVPLIDLGVANGVPSQNPIVRQRNVSPATFKQDQFTTRIDSTLFKGDANGKNLNTLSGTFFFANFPATEPFPESTLASPFPVLKNDRNRTMALTNTHFFSSSLINEARFGYFSLDNTRELDPRLLGSEFTNTQLGIPNPAKFFVPGAESERCAHHVGRYNIQDFSVCAPNDVFNRRKQTTLTFANNLSFVLSNHTLRFGVEYKRNSYDTNLPEEQGTEFEKFDNFTQGLNGFVAEADTAFGITDKQFRFNDLSFYASDEWRFRQNLTFSLGLRWDMFGRPNEKNGHFSNFDPSLLTNPDDPRPGFVLPANTRDTGFVAIDASLPGITRSNNNHTLNGQDLNNFAPRFGFRYSPFKTERTIISGGYGIFYDRPSASFINTVYTNYPFLREVEETIDSRPFATPFNLLFQRQSTTRRFSDYLPYRISLESVGGNGSPYFLLDNTQTGASQGFAEPLELRAVDRNLKTPLIQQWNFGVQQQFGRDWVVEARYIGTKGQDLLVAVGFNQPYDLNDTSTPEYIFKRINDAYARAGSPNGPLRTSGNERQRGCGIAFGNVLQPGIVVPGIAYPSGPQCSNTQGTFEYNLDIVGGGGSSFDIIDAELRVPYLGIDPTDAVMLRSSGYSIYHGGQLNVTKRFSNNYTFNVSYTYSNSMDIGSSDPGSTTASGRPDTANLGLVVQGDQRDINSNRARSDFDRRHRVVGSLVWDLPYHKSKNKLLGGWRMSGTGQWQSGSPFSIFATDVEAFEIANESLVQEAVFLGLFSQGGRSVLGNNPPRIVYLPGRTAGLLFNAAFGRPNVVNFNLLAQRNCPDLTRCYFNTNARSFASVSTGLAADPSAVIAPTYGRFGNLGRNVLTGPDQKRIDLSLQKSTRFRDRFELEFKWDIFNLFNLVNFANPNADLTDETDFGQITRTVGAPRVMQFGVKLKF